MEDSHTLIAPFDKVHGQGFFAVFDGHAGKHAAEWCGQHFHEVRPHFISQRELTSPVDTIVSPPPPAPVSPEGDEEQPDLIHS